MLPKELHPAEQLILTTIRIETITTKGISTGTGFFFGLNHNPKEDTHIPVIVTNKHVIKNAITGKLRFSIKDEEGNPVLGRYFDLELSDFEKRWVPHPERDIDLCVLPIANIYQEIRNSKHDINHITLIHTDIPSHDDLNTEFSRIEDIMVVGYPDGIWDSVNNIPITRKGITATPLQVDFENTPRFLIDAAIYGGSSGSPVFIFNQGSYHPPSGGLVVGTRLFLVGIVYAVAQHTVTGELKIVDIPAKKMPVTQTLIPNNLGVAIHARKLLDFEKLLK